VGLNGVVLWGVAFYWGSVSNIWVGLKYHVIDVYFQFILLGVWEGYYVYSGMNHNTYLNEHFNNA
jgi:hypothetical protein